MAYRAYMVLPGTPDYMMFTTRNPGRFITLLRYYRSVGYLLASRP